MNRSQRRHVLASVFLLISVSFSQQAPPASSPQKITDLRPTVLFISIDAFRADYLNSTPAPNLQKLAASGVSGAMIPVFPTLTFPNHYSIVTGLYPAHNGIVSNVFRDPKYPDVTFKSWEDKVKIESRWWLGEPIWVTAEKQHQHAAMLYWPGSDVEIQGMRPTRWQLYKKRPVPNESVAQLLSWFDVSTAERPTVFGLYFEDVDHAGHDFGPSSAELKEAVATVDVAIGKLIEGFEQRGIADKINIIIVADHGMSQLSRDRLIVLDDFVDVSKIDVAYEGPAYSFYLKDPNDKETLAKLQKIRHATLFTRASMRKRWHYSGSDRIAPYLLLADDGWSITNKKYLEGHPKFATGGAHGYDNNLHSMQPVFIASGPAFKAGGTIKPFPNVDLYDLFAHLQGLTPAKNDGNWKVFRPVLKDGGKTHANAAGK
jgi:predicted AlkP superfamily pyrophosphatase or phosphodiesterase